MEETRVAGQWGYAGEEWLLYGNDLTRKRRARRFRALV